MKSLAWKFPPRQGPRNYSMVATAGHPLLPKKSKMQDNEICKEQILETHYSASTRYHTKISKHIHHIYILQYPPRLCLVVHGVERPKKPGNKTPGPSLPTGDCPKLRPVGNLRSTRVPCFNPFDVFSDLHIWKSYRTYTVEHHKTS